MIIVFMIIVDMIIGFSNAGIPITLYPEFFVLYAEEKRIALLYVD